MVLEIKKDKYTGRVYSRTKCSACKQCWKEIGATQCIYGGPYEGYVQAPKEDPVSTVLGPEPR